MNRRASAFMRERSGRTRGMSLAVVVGGLLCLVAIAFLIAEIVREFRFYNSANSDNVHWALSQAEVEFLEFQRAIHMAQMEASPQALEQVVEEFDVFYSRITTLTTGALYAPLRETIGFGSSTTAIRDALDRMIPVMDGPSEGLIAALPALERETTILRPRLREATTNGLQYFAVLSDRSRETVAVTLLRLGVVVVVLLLALLLLLRHTRRVGRQIERRGQELAGAYARLNTIMDTALDAVIVSDLDGKILNFNPAAERIFGYRYDEVWGRSIGEVLVPEDLRAAHEAGMERMKQTGEVAVVGQGRVRLEAQRKGGEVFPVEMALERARTGDQELIVGFLRDISHRVRQETELVKARDRALAGEQAKSEFLAMMTHEIRTPLNGLLGNLSLLKGTALDGEQGRYLRNMETSGAVLMRHVDAVLDVARFEAGAAGTSVEVVNLGQLVGDLVASQQGAAAARGNVMRWEWVGPKVDWVRLDAVRLSQALLNLVGNAIKFTRDGQIIVEVEAEAPDLEFRVIDTGPGLAETDRERVFVDFQTAGGEEPGTGLGLGIARRFVGAMGGEIGVESEPGEGCVFWMRLPLQTAEAPGDEAAGADALVAPVRDVLLVEDNEINLELARDMLRAGGHRVTEARNGAEAVAAAQGHRFDVILMDIRMPVMDGLDATRAIRAGQGACREVPIMALSANVLPEARDRFVAAGMSGFLAKPLSQDDLTRVLFACCPERASGRGAGLCVRYNREVAALFEWFGRIIPESMANEERESLAEEAHRVAGSAAAFGQPGLRDALVAVEEAALAGGHGLAASIEAARKARAAAPVVSLG